MPRCFPLWATHPFVRPQGPPWPGGLGLDSCPSPHSKAETWGAVEGRVWGLWGGGREQERHTAGVGLGLSRRLASWPAVFRKQAGLRVGAGSTLLLCHLQRPLLAVVAVGSRDWVRGLEFWKVAVFSRG